MAEVGAVRKLNVVMEVGRLDGNHVGRAYCLWLLATELGHRFRIVGSGPLWEPLRDSPFADDCIERCRATAVVSGADVVIVRHPLADTLGRAMAYGRPVLLDVDEPLWEQLFGYRPGQQLRVVAGKVRRRQDPRLHLRLRRVSRRLPTLISNDALRALYPGATVVPHVRADHGSPPMPGGDTLRVAFVGTWRSAKGVELLRSAIARVPDVELVATMDPPGDAAVREHWVGQTTLDEGRQLLRTCQVAAVLSEDTPWTRMQLPVKLIDAMEGGRVVLASDLPPIRWALGDCGVIVPAGDEEAVVGAIARLSCAGDLVDAGARARRRYEDRYRPDVVAPRFDAALRWVLSS